MQSVFGGDLSWSGWWVFALDRPAGSYYLKTRGCPFLPRLACICFTENFPKLAMRRDSESGMGIFP
jgi:hypothetical protein